MAELPGSRLGDKTVCVVHGTSGIISRPTSKGVWIEEVGVGRLGDMCTCDAGDPSPLAEGAATVLVDGLPAARITMHTVDGGSIVAGDERVLVGGPTFTLPAFVKLAGDAAFQAATLRNLFKILSGEDGQQWLDSMAGTGADVTIGPTVCQAQTRTDPQLDAPGADGDFNNPNAYNGVGTSSKISYDPSKDHADARLFHEMMHSDDMAHGTLDKTPYPNPGGGPMEPTTYGGEKRAMGLAPYDDRSKYPYNEGTYRDHHGYPPVKAH